MESVGRFVERCSAGLTALYGAGVESSAGVDARSVYEGSVRCLVGMLAALVAAEQMPEERSCFGAVRRAAEAVIASSRDQGLAAVNAYEDAAAEACDLSGIGIFGPCESFRLSRQAIAAAAYALLRPSPDAPIEPIFFQSMPLSWLGCAYQGLLALRPDADGGLEATRSHRKKTGAYFTPPSLVSYIVESVMAPLVESIMGRLGSMPAPERLSTLRILDPAMGGGDFLARTVEFVGGSAGAVRAEIAANCVYGLDIDPTAVEIARFCTWASAGYADGIAGPINSHLICANALGEPGERVCALDWAGEFPDVFDRGGVPGFDAVVGNPPYIASKNGLRAGAGRRGQSDSYLLFLSAAMDNHLVKPGGMLSMVLPDPMLVRENAAAIRSRLVMDWTIVSLLHILGAFSDAVVANIVPVCRNAPASGTTFFASRIECAADRRGFMLRPRRTAEELAQPVRMETIAAQRRSEFLYLLEAGSFGEVIRRIHGKSAALSHYEPPFAPLRSLNTKAIYRGEEVGKAAIREGAGDLPMLLGGQSVRPYKIEWEGRGIDRSRVAKPLDRYLSTKVLIQKSSARLIAALDVVSHRHPGFVFPQSVYAVELREPGMHELYLLAILNSEVMNEYICRTVTGYKLMQPQLELEDIRALPIRRVSFITPAAERHADAARAVRIFERESSGRGAGAFPELANFVAQCLTGAPERSDVVHDLLVHLGRLVVDMTARMMKSPDAETARCLEAARVAVETVVWRLYSSQPAQMTLPW